jgi:hypothetical protein
VSEGGGGVTWQATWINENETKKAKKKQKKRNLVFASEGGGKSFRAFSVFEPLQMDQLMVALGCLQWSS